MEPRTIQPPYDRLLATAEQVAQERPEVDLEMAREVFLEAAVLLDDGLALDGLDAHDADVVIAGLCSDLVDADPAAAVRDRAAAAVATPGDLHDPAGVAASLRVSALILQL